MAWHHTSWEALWHAHDGFSVPVVAEEETLCTYAQRFAAWVEQHCQHAWEQPSLVSINQVKVLLLDHYFNLRAVAPKVHRERIGERGHICIHHILERAYARLRMEELGLAPPLLFLPEKPKPTPPPAPAPQPIIQLPPSLEKALEDYALGEILGDEED